MTLAEKYGIQKTRELEEINLNQNPYTFEGTFAEIYELLSAGRIKLLKMGDIVVGGSVCGYPTTEEDNLAGTAFMKAYANKPVL